MTNLDKEQQLLVIRESLVSQGVKHRGRPVPFGITTDLINLPPQTVERVHQAGNVVGSYLTAINDLMIRPEYSDLRQDLPELRLLNRPETTRINAIAPEIVPSMFRLDLVMEPDGGFEASEIELLFGGLGFREALRNTIAPQNPPRSLGVGFARMLNYLSQGRQDRCSIVTIDAPVIKPYLEDLAVFGRTVRGIYPNYDLVFSNDLRTDENGNLISADNPEPIRLVHRFFEIYHGAHGQLPNFDLLTDAYQRGVARDIPSLKQYFEEKLAMALAWKPELESYFESQMSSEGLTLMREIIPYTALLSADKPVLWKGRLVPVTSEQAIAQVRQHLMEQYPGGSVPKMEAVNWIQTSSLFSEGKKKRVLTPLYQQKRTVSLDEVMRLIIEAGAALSLSNLPEREKNMVTKESGFSEGAAEAKSVTMHRRLKPEDSEAALRAAIASGLIYVIQEETRHTTYKVAGLLPRYSDYRASDIEPDSLEVVTYERGYARMQPYYFQTGPRKWELGEVFATVCPDPKAHGRTDAIMTLVDF